MAWGAAAARFDGGKVGKSWYFEARRALVKEKFITEERSFQSIGHLEETK
jgi:hypothetical protein